MFSFFKKNEKNQTERRGAQRIVLETSCLIEFTCSRYKGARLAEVKDISSSGIRFASIWELKKKDKLKIKVIFPKEFPGRKNFECDAEVARVYQSKGSDRQRVGCFFKDVMKQDQEVLYQFLFWLESQPSQK